MKDRKHNIFRMDEIYGVYSIVFTTECINRMHTKIAADELADFINEQNADTVIIKGYSDSGSLVQNINGIWESNAESIENALSKAKESSEGTIFCCTSSYWNCTLDRLEGQLQAQISTNK